MGWTGLQIDVQILAARLQHTAVDACLGASFGKPVFREIAGRVVVAKHVEAAKAGRKPDGGEMCGGEACGHGQGREERQKREHGLDAFACGHDVFRLAEADRVAEQMTHGAARIGQGRFIAAVAGEPGALQAGQIAVEAGDDAEQRGPALAVAAVIGTVIAGGVKAKAGPISFAAIARERR